VGATGFPAIGAGCGVGVGGTGGTGGDASNPVGGAGGAGGNGGGPAGLCLMIAPSITYTGSVVGRFIKIEGTAAHELIRGFYS